MNYYLSSRQTIQDGEVVTIATSFEPLPGISSTGYRATGQFEISVSRNAVMIHRACLKSWDECRVFAMAIQRASEIFVDMRRGCESNRI